MTMAFLSESKTAVVGQLRRHHGAPFGRLVPDVDLPTKGLVANDTPGITTDVDSPEVSPHYRALTTRYLMWSGTAAV